MKEYGKLLQGGAISAGDFEQAVADLPELEAGPLYVVNLEASGNGVLKASLPEGEESFDVPLAALSQVTPLTLDGADPSRLLAHLLFREGFESLPDTFASLVEARSQPGFVDTGGDAGVFITLPEETLEAIDTEGPVHDPEESGAETDFSGLESVGPRFNRKVFFEKYRAAFGSALSQSQVDGLQALLGFLEADANMTDVRWSAYLMATVKHECANRWRPIEEFSSGRQYCGRRDLGNTSPGDGPRFKGRGYVQITGRRNYRKMGQLLGANLESTPLRTLEPVISYKIASLGMRRGLFTGKKLADSIHGSTCDYRNARRIINGLDRADLIKGYAVKFEAVLRASQAA